MTENIVFEYLYRDAGNYKFHGAMIFKNSTDMALEEADERLRSSLEEREIFIASQVRIPDVFPFLNGVPTEDDHCYHEFSSVRLTDKTPDDVHGRSIAEVVREFEAEARRGWRAFDPVFLIRP